MNSAVPNQPSTEAETPAKTATKTFVESPVPPAPQPFVSRSIVSEALEPWNRPNRQLSPAERREAKEKARIKRQLLEKIVANRLGLRDQVFTRGLRAIINRNLNALASEMIADAFKKSKYITTRNNKKS